MGKRNHLELYEILNRHNVVDRADLGQREIVESIPEPQVVSMSSDNRNNRIDASVDASIEGQQSLHFNNNTMDDVMDQALPMPTEETYSPEVADEVVEETQVVQNNPVEQAQTAGPPYNFQLAPPRTSAERNEEVFGERRLQFSYDTVILGGIVVLVMFVVTFIVGAKFGSVSGPEEGNVSRGDLVLPVLPVPGDPIPDPAVGSGDPEPVLPVDRVEIPALQVAKFYTVIVCAVYKPNETKLSEIQRFVAYLKEQGFPDVFTRKVGRYVQVCTGRSESSISTQSSLVHRAQQVQWKDPQTRSLYRGNTAFPREIKPSN